MNTLLAISIEATIYDIFIILGVVVAASLIVYFIWEAILIYSNKKNGKGTTSETKGSNAQPGMQSFSLDQNKETALLEEGNVVDVESEEEDETISEEEEERLNRERREYLERRRQELIKKLQEEDEQQEEAEEESEEVEEVSDEEIEDDVQEEVEENEIQEEVADEAEEETAEEVADNLERERVELLREKEKYEQMCRELEEAKRQLLETIQNPEQPAVLTPVDELKERLVILEEKLKANEKEFKQCKKDFIPLNKVWKTYENDKKKLQRREALVAKQNVMLYYGVNNYADIDEEKAKKLAEDLDLLDGLKISVQHCEEVMEKNSDRYPLLKKMYEVLKKQNTELKDEIKELKTEIEKRENKENNEGTEEE